ncbi:DUF4275 family protein [Siminovitchia fordii]|uniref:DUF4275 family protein n=1 Tax=Siminovitchia fordii TaxID=254759 RepID=UPI001BB45E11|nr:DUF4275 family protein [Siminovitchia fordii]
MENNKRRQKELKLIEIPKWGNYLREQWRGIFANHLSKVEQKSIYMDSFLWHLCSWEKVFCLEKEKAIEAFESQLKNKCTIFYQNTDEAYLVQHAKNLKINDLPFEENHMYYSDIYVMDWNNGWTFVMTHETESGIGPYFIQKP